MTDLDIIQPTIAASLAAECTGEGGESLVAVTAGDSGEGKDEQHGKSAFLIPALHLSPRGAEAAAKAFLLQEKLDPRSRSLASGPSSFVYQLLGL
jgi:hypothetical protein